MSTIQREPSLLSLIVGGFVVGAAMFHLGGIV
jgi:hypothetical protein